MSGSRMIPLLLLLLLRGSQANHYYGTVMTFTPKDTRDDGSVEVVCRYKLSFRSCTDGDQWSCASGKCGTQILELNIVDEQAGEWCQREGVMTREVSGTTQFQLTLSGGDWISGIKNGVSNWLAVTHVDLRIRSDTGQPNQSPQTTILPALRVPSNCQRDFNFLAFDPDGDEVRCRYGDSAAQECNPCSPPSVLMISPTCTLSFLTTSSSNEGPYAVQLEMEDFATQTIVLEQSDGVKTTRTGSDALSKIPIRFALIVDPAVPSCTEGLYIPKFLPPTPPSQAQLITYVNQTLEIIIKAEAVNSLISGLFFSGPHGIVKQTRSEGEFGLSWTPSEEEDGENHPICFVIQAENNPTKYHSELRCVIVSVRSEPLTTVLPTTFPPPTTTPLNTTSIPLIPVESNRTVMLEKSKESGNGQIF
ncbi:uncharacterized protein LOC113168344 [Anabas testudineus]|uniref:uncharacterized protein LOC113168344 n=1 Tax=Anabas testudineus TaxID=64144 RepID=UPI000E45A128|nr:uncharacterized protein LOC113168344 [Anabas testudineus]